MGARLWTYMIIMMGITIVMKFTGIPTGVDSFLAGVGLANNTASVTTSAFFVSIAALLVLATATGIGMGLIGGVTPEFAILAPFASVWLLLFASNIIALLNYSSSLDTWMYYPIFAVFGTLAVGFGMTIVDYVMGRE